MAESSRQIAPVSGAHGPRAGRRVLLAALPSVQRRTLAAQLAAAGLRVTLAGTPAEAQAAAALRPDFVLCEWSVGALTAEAFCTYCRTLWTDDAYTYVVVIVPPDCDGVERVIAAGADDFLMTPLVPVELTARLSAGERFLNLAERLQQSKQDMAAALTSLQAAQEATEADLAQARQLQQGLLGDGQARFGEVEATLLLRPAGHIGGDLVGFFPISSRRAGFYAIDVSGHGVTAALHTARIAAHFTGFAGENIALRLDENDLYDAAGPVEVARRFNQLLLEEMVTDSYFTMLYVDLDILSGRGSLVQAGHPHPLLQQPDGSVEVLGQGGLPIGLVPEADWEEVQFQLSPGARLFIGSDGLTETESPGGHLLGEDGLIAILRTNAFLRGVPLLESLCWSAAQFTGGGFRDDISAIVIDRDPSPR